MKTNRIEMIKNIRLQFEKSDIQPAPKVVNFADYPWEECIDDQIKAYGDEETAKKVCGAIKAGMKKEGFVIPSPEGGEDEQTYISRCISSIIDEYTEDGQAYAVCKGEWDK